MTRALVLSLSTAILLAFSARLSASETPHPLLRFGQRCLSFREMEESLQKLPEKKRRVAAAESLKQLEKTDLRKDSLGAGFSRYFQARVQLLADERHLAYASFVSAAASRGVAPESVLGLLEIANKNKKPKVCAQLELLLGRLLPTSTYGRLANERASPLHALGGQPIVPSTSRERLTKIAEMWFNTKSYKEATRAYAEAIYCGFAPSWIADVDARSGESWLSVAVAPLYIRAAEAHRLLGNEQVMADYLAKAIVFGTPAQRDEAMTLLRKWARSSKPKGLPRPKPNVTQLERVVRMYAGMNMHPRAIRIVEGHSKLFGDKAKPLKESYSKAWLALLDRYCAGRGKKCVLFGQDVLPKDKRLAIDIPFPCNAKALKEVRAALTRKTVSAVPSRVEKLVKQLKDSDPGARLYAAGKLGQLWTKAAGAVPALIEALDDKDPRVRAAAVASLGGIRLAPEKVVPKLIKMLDGKDKKLRHAAVIGLRRFGPDSKAAVPALIKLLPTKDHSLRTDVISALGRIGPEAKAAVPALTKALGEGFRSRIHPIKALSGIGPGAKGAVPALTKLLETASRYEKSDVAEALGKIGPAAKPAIPALEKLLKSKGAVIRVTSALALWRITSKPDKVVPVLTKALKFKAPRKRTEMTEEKEVDGLLGRLRAAFALAELGPKAKAALPDLAAALATKDSSFEKALCKAIGSIGPEAAPALPALIKAGGNEEDGFYPWVIDAIGGIGPPAKKTLPLLTKFLKLEDDVEVNCAAALAIWRITGDSKKALPVLIKALDNADETYSDRLRAVRAMGQMGPAAKSAVPHLEKLLKDNSPVLRRGAAKALRNIRGEGKKGPKPDK